MDLVVLAKGHFEIEIVGLGLPNSNYLNCPIGEVEETVTTHYVLTFRGAALVNEHPLAETVVVIANSSTKTVMEPLMAVISCIILLSHRADNV